MEILFDKHRSMSKMSLQIQSSKPTLSLTTSKREKLIESYTLYKNPSVWVLSWLFPKWFDELTNHIGVTKPRSFTSISKFYILLVCNITTKDNISYLTSFFHTYVFSIFDHYYVQIEHKSTNIRKRFNSLTSIAYFCMVKTNNTIASTTCCLTNKSSKTNLIYKGSSCNLCNRPKWFDYIQLG
jgi:hypothetical protein